MVRADRGAAAAFEGLWGHRGAAALDCSSRRRRGRDADRQRIAPRPWTRFAPARNAGEFTFPVKYGYCSVGVVARCGDDARHLEGERVFCLHPRGAGVGGSSRRRGRVCGSSGEELAATPRREHPDHPWGVSGVSRRRGDDDHPRGGDAAATG